MTELDHSSDDAILKPKRNRWRFQFRLITLLVLITVVALPLGYYCQLRADHEAEQTAIAALKELPARTEDSEVSIDVECMPPHPDLSQYLGPGNVFDRAVRARIRGRELSRDCVPHLLTLKQLTRVTLSNTGIDDAAFIDITNLPTVRAIRVLGEEHITDAGMQGLANCPQLVNLWLENVNVGDDG